MVAENLLQIAKSEQNSADFLFRIKQGVVEHRCMPSIGYWVAKDARRICKSCRRSESPKSHTILANSKLPSRCWLVLLAHMIIGQKTNCTKMGAEFGVHRNTIARTKMILGGQLLKNGKRHFPTIQQVLLK